MTPDLGAELRRLVNALLEFLVTRHAAEVEAVGRFVARPVGWIEVVLTAAPAPALIALAALAAYRFASDWRFSGAMAALLAAILLLGVWAEAMRTLALMTGAVSLAFLLGVPLGIAGARIGWFGRMTRPVYDLMQTIPSFVYLIPAAMMMGLGTAPALLATTIVAVPPLARLTDHGLSHVDSRQVDAARALGLTTGQSLRFVELPLAWPTVMAGLNQSVMAALGMVVVASMIGARGLGEVVLIGLQRADAGTGVVGGLAIVLLAVFVDRMTQVAGAQRRPPGRAATGASGSR